MTVAIRPGTTLLAAMLVLAGAGEGLPPILGEGRTHILAAPAAPLDQTPLVRPAEEASTSVSGRIAVSPIVIRLAAVTPRPTTRALVQARATITNLSGATVARISMSISVVPDGISVRPTETKVLRNLRPGTTADATWSLCASSGGTFTVVALAAVAGSTIVSAPIVVQVPGGRCQVVE